MQYMQYLQSKELFFEHTAHLLGITIFKMINTFGKRVSRRGREKRDSEEVWLHNSVNLVGVVHGMRKLWRPYSQSYFWAEPPKIMLGQGVVSTT